MGSIWHSQGISLVYCICRKSTYSRIFRFKTAWWKPYRTGQGFYHAWKLRTSSSDSYIHLDHRSSITGLIWFNIQVKRWILTKTDCQPPHSPSSHLKSQLQISHITLWELCYHKFLMPISTPPPPSASLLLINCPVYIIKPWLSPIQPHHNVL